METSERFIHNTNTIDAALRRLGGYKSIYVPEFTYGAHRIDAAVIDLQSRWIRGFEIKTSFSDFKRDDKYLLYSQFLSSLSIVCPIGLIPAVEVQKPVGLLWIGGSATFPEFHWVKKPKRFQCRESLAWFWTYTHVIEKELPRLEFENQTLRAEISYLQKQIK